MINRRQHFRLRKQLDVHWTVPSQKAQGQGIILNISLPGMLFVTDRLFKAEDGLKMNFSVEGVPSFPAQGNLVWFRRIGAQGERYLCGALFSIETLKSRPWIQWMDGHMEQMADALDSKILGRILSEEA